VKKILISGVIVLFLGIAGYRVGRKIPYLLKRKHLNVILVTIDTLRADHLGCYGYGKAKTPNIDELCAHGIKFTNCIAQVPLTLPSHTTILSGTYPFYHNVKDNGGFVVSEKLETLAEILKKHGFTTGAVVGAYVLDGRWGLDQGFDFYYDNFDLSRYKRISLNLVERRADEVVSRAIGWLKANKNRRFFLWVHVYDPHSPYTPPPPFDEEFAEHPYDGEIAFTDLQLGRLFRFLEDEGLDKKTLIVLTADHGESLGEHGEETHGFFVYQSTVWVPLIVKTPIRGLSGKVVKTRVGLVDIAPTILDFLGYPIPGEMQGKSLKDLLFNPGKELERLLYTESFYPRFHFGWHELKAVYWRNYKYIDTRSPELYDLAKDPSERENLYLKNNRIAKKMKAMLLKFERTGTEHALNAHIKEMDPETRAKLGALGYISTFVGGKDEAQLADPKEKIGIFNAIIKARKLTRQGKTQEAIALLKSILKEEPGIVDAIFTLGNLYYREKDFETALKYFKKVLELKPDYNFAMLNILNCYRFLGKTDQGIEEARKFIKIFPQQSEFYIILANFYVDEGKLDEAEKTLERALKIEENPFALRDLGRIRLMKDDLEKAEDLFNRAIKLNPSIKMAHYYIALIKEKEGETEAAIEEYEKEIENNPENLKAHFNLARLYRERGERDKEIAHLEKVVELAPDFQIGLLYLAKAYLDEGRSLERAIKLAQRGIELNPSSEYAVFGYYILSDIYALMGDKSRSEEYYRKGLFLKAKINKNNRRVP